MKGPRAIWTRSCYLMEPGVVDASLCTACHEKNNNDKVLLEAGVEHLAAVPYAMQAGHLDTVKVLLEAGADLQAVGDCGCTALELAVKQGHLQSVKFLAEKGADMNRTNKRAGGRTPLHVAVAKPQSRTASDITNC
ncbi:hypothetical protein WJX72_009739 [[Myrmecia] bisecta]|uniref:Uncharacterized protein n=1 Tax=[Myrmecia] bisecta TaxID=41462 RepID=A0AAW1PHU6_9CHLO